MWGPQCGIREMMGMELKEEMDIFVVYGVWICCCIVGDV